ncbi:hypothetical protein WJX74_001666 [Apatococcus lobatus]|uniref:Serine aminopeptidase S33 domain-containing protein n=1 Tax=Apatococcus lobatus TaxID=904363 RepID=A0AAW1REM6_9CHLO
MYQRRQQVAKRLRFYSAVAGAGFLAYLGYYLTKVCKTPTLVYRSGALSHIVRENCSSLIRAYYPPLWAFNTHLQTALGVLRGAAINAGWVRQLVPTSDGGQFALDWWQGETSSNVPPETPIVLVLHGVTGGSFEGTCKAMCKEAASRGYRPAVMVYRGCGGVELLNDQIYSANFTDDAHLAVETINRQYPNAKLTAVGFSLGSIILTKYLGEADSGHWEPEGDGIAAAVAISSPFCLESAGRFLARPWTIAWLYNLIIAYRLKMYGKWHHHVFKDCERLEHVSEKQRQFWTIGQFDERIMSKMMGFQSAQEYYQAASSLPQIPKIRTPILFLAAEDDVFLGELPIRQCSSNPYTLLAITSRGGHVAFLTGLWPFGQAWMDQVALDFLQAVLSHPERIAQIGTEVSSVRPHLSSVQGRSPRKSGRRSVDQALNMAAAALDRHSSMGNMGMATDPGSLEDLVGRAASLMSGTGRASPEPLKKISSRADAGRDLMGTMGRAASFQTALDSLKRSDSMSHGS